MEFDAFVGRRQRVTIPCEPCFLSELAPYPGLVVHKRLPQDGKGWFISERTTGKSLLPVDAPTYNRAEIEFAVLARLQNKNITPEYFLEIVAKAT